ncbi:hypothetical protein J2X72_003926 [Phyllobacterium sp. 1468]|nr:hypothetical protein [Phyllobacterium sp. 1468]
MGKDKDRSTSWGLAIELDKDTPAKSCENALGDRGCQVELRFSPPDRDSLTHV